MHSQGGPLDEIIEIFTKEMNDFFEGIEKICDTYGISTSIREYLAERKRATHNLLVNMVKGNKFLDLQSVLDDEIEAF